MKQNNITAEKKSYAFPELTRVEIDSQISLALESNEEGNPDGDPNGDGWLSDNTFSNSPMKA